ncbi:RBBP9/YdeN family alpha/beta hydrolase [Campylobacter helveticus]|uniref:RBBP9/YdeN family alpha/beta hydrolase n=1 Tax=Campylobacter helveticus TaxID=28898 RepID=UPI00111775CF|nr:alpha/beta hydrolase [Campylobacter helveticus]TNH34028.1 serine hydrolase family protein [Campylobacter helveticus]TNH36507.1 serine hydrolase family protein [Campylobacter helveticus]
MKKILLILPLFAILLNAKGVYILHGFNCDSNYAWIPSVRQELNDLGYEVKALDLPNASKPELKKWLETMDKELVLDEKTYFITHSLGGVILVSPFDEPLEILPILDNFTHQKPHYESLKTLIKHRVVISAKDDKIVPTSLSQKLAKSLNAKLILVEKGGHFMDTDGFKDLPLVVEELKKMKED